MAFDSCKANQACAPAAARSVSLFVSGLHPCITSQAHFPRDYARTAEQQGLLHMLQNSAVTYQDHDGFHDMHQVAMQPQSAEVCCRKQ